MLDIWSKFNKYKGKLDFVVYLAKFHNFNNNFTDFLLKYLLAKSPFSMYQFHFSILPTHFKQI